jgi:type III secretory pathway component EscU
VGHSFSIIITTLLILLASWLTYRQGKLGLAFSIAGISVALLGIIVWAQFAAPAAMLLVLMVAILITLISYWGLINVGYRKAGKVVAIVLAIAVAVPFLSFAFEDYLFSKEDVRQMLREDRIELKDDFRIRSNSISGISDTYQKFELEISSRDRDQLIHQLRRSPYYRTGIKQSHSLIDQLDPNKIQKKICVDYEIGDNLYRET